MGLKSFFTVKETINKKRKQTDWEEIFANDTTDKGLTSNIYERFKYQKTKSTQSKTRQKI